MDIYAPKKCKKTNRNIQNGSIGGVGKGAFRITQ
jgi:hypothetical protein